ncbi:hypothetical protein [Dokdonia sp.]|uniref:hypothetical protein n=1 Tax=Dokdonia sp. TaxID=2024995 RepID=UPI0032673840
MKNIIQKSLFIILTCILVSSCSKSYEPITLQKFETELKAKNIETMTYDSTNRKVLIELINSEEIFEIQNNDETILSKHWIRQVKDIVSKYNTTDIQFINQM